MTTIRDFVEKLVIHAERKAILYDGVGNDMPVDTALRYAIEEIGEVATDISRDRIQGAKDECIDLAHCAMLIYFALERRG